MKKSVVAGVATFILCLFLSGCWGKIEINRLAIVMAAALDLEENSNKIVLTAQIANPAATSSEDGGKGGDKSFAIVKGSGPTLEDAELDLYTRLPRLAYWSNMQVIIISEKLAREKMDAIIDYLDRPLVLRREMHLVVVPDPSKAQDVLTAKNVTEKMSGLAIANIQKFAYKHSKTVYPSDIHDFLLDLSDDGVEPILARLEIKSSPGMNEGQTKSSGVKGQEETKKGQLNTGGSGEQEKADDAADQKTLNLSGSAVFRKTKMVGWLNDVETRGALWVWGEMQQGMLTFPYRKNKKKLVNVLNQRADRKIVLKIKNGKPRITVKINAEGELKGVNFVTKDMITSPEMMKRLDAEYQKTIKNEVNTSIAKVKKEYAADIFGFGEMIACWRPKLWKKLKPRWDDEFRKLPVEVKVEAHIRRIGLSMGPTNPH